MKSLLEVDSIVVELGGRKILHDVYLKNESGTATGILGRNGTGKSCLLQVISGGLSPSQQSIKIDGVALSGSYRSPKDLQYLPQYHFIPAALTTKAVFRDFRLDIAAFMREFPAFETCYRQPLKQLSSGERRLIELYVVLTAPTKFCLLDEPFSMLAPKTIEQIKQLIRREKSNKGILVTDHSYRHVLDVCEHAYLIREGKTYPVTSEEDLEALGYIRGASSD